MTPTRPQLQYLLPKINTMASRPSHIHHQLVSFFVSNPRHHTPECFRFHPWNNSPAEWRCTPDRRRLYRMLSGKPPAEWCSSAKLGSHVNIFPVTIFGVNNFTVNISPMLKPYSSSSKPSMDIIIALHCLNLAFDHTWENIMLSKFNSLEFHNVLAFIPTEGRFLIKLIPQVLTCSQSSSRSQKFWNKERDEKELNQVHKFKSSCILLMNSHLTLSLKPIYSTSFPLITYICGRLYMELWESLVLPRYYKWDVVKTKQASHGLTETRQKGHWKIMLSQGGEREKYTHLR
jgi:hypothetical protein